MIRALQEETSTKIDIDDDGTVYISAADSKNEAEFASRIEALIESPHPRTHLHRQSGARRRFWRICGNSARYRRHGSHFPAGHGRVEKVEDVAGMGEEITVMVTNIDNTGKIRLSRTAVLEGWTVEEAQQPRRSQPRKRPHGRPSGGRPSGGGYNRDNNRR